METKVDKLLINGEDTNSNGNRTARRLQESCCTQGLPRWSWTLQHMRGSNSTFQRLWHSRHLDTIPCWCMHSNAQWGQSRIQKVPRWWQSKPLRGSRHWALIPMPQFQQEDWALQLPRCPYIREFGYAYLARTKSNLTSSTGKYVEMSIKKSSESIHRSGKMALNLLISGF